jgi:ABC-2 type transport system ATP-binding protein
VLLARGLVKSYGATRALAGLDLELAPGEMVALLGPNGAGKTTLFQLLTGLFAADEGTVRIGGADVAREPVRALAVLGVVFQQPTLDLDLSVAANLRFHARLHGLPRAAARSRIASELARLGLADRGGAPCRTLSGGNRRRVELARALLTEPRVLLMDEPTVGLDPASRRAILDHVGGLATERGTAVLWATHLVDEAEEAHRVLVLHRGVLRAAGSPRELVEAAGARSLSAAFLALTADGTAAAAG